MTILDLEELMMFLLGKDDYEDEDEIYEAFEAKYEMTPDAAFKLVKDLLPLCMVAESPLTKTVYQGLATNNMWLIKRELIKSRVEQ